MHGEVGGFLLAGSATPGFFGPKHAEWLRRFADQSAIALENTRLFEEARKAAERQQLLSRRLVEVQEEERRHIARELHDEIGQTLTGLTLLLEMSARQTGDAARDNLSEAQALTHDLLARVREMSLNLRPAMLDDLGLLPALLWHLERYTARTHVRVVLKHALPEQRFAPEVETVAYRVVQEALTNVARHAGVSEATVRLWTTQNTLGVQVEDQGTGFDPEAQLADDRASGLSGMRERAALLGGQLTIESSPGGGTCLTVELPLHQFMEAS
jgi:signal transduction histidine kinase